MSSSGSRRNKACTHQARVLRSCTTRFVHYELDPVPDDGQQPPPDQQGAGGVIVPKYLQVGVHSTLFM